ncbi:MAG: hypothetical protein ABIH23_19660 [bacterium]
MASQPQLINNPFRQARDDVKELHRTLGIALRISDLIDAGLERGIFPREVLDRCTRDGLAKFCRDALKEKTEAGLPYAKPITSGEDSRWQQLNLFSCEEAVALLSREHNAVKADIVEFHVLLAFFRDRYGSAIPEFPF